MTMTRSEFHNALRLIRSIDAFELVGEDVSWKDAPDWVYEFVRDPYNFFIRCPDEQADINWKAMEKRGI